MDQTETQAEYWLVLWRDTGTGGAAPVARTADCDLVKAVIKGLGVNRLHEDDEQDCILDPELIRCIPAIIADFARRMRQAACRNWPNEVMKEIFEEDFE